MASGSTDGPLATSQVMAGGYAVKYAAEPLAPTQGFNVSFMNLGGSATDFRTSKDKKGDYEIQIVK